LMLLQQQLLPVLLQQLLLVLLIPGLNYHPVAVGLHWLGFGHDKSE